MKRNKFNKQHLMYAGIIVLLVVNIFAFFWILNLRNQQSLIEDSPMEQITGRSTTEFYQMFQCPCCGKPIDTNCCGMAKQRKKYVDELLLDGVEENELVARVVKKFGFGTLMDSSMEQNVRDYLKSQATENPPKIEIDNPRYDFGTISQADGIVSTTFTIKNTGKSDLIIENMDSSCMCTTAQLTYNGKKSPVFGMSMHGGNPENFALHISSGESAQLEVFYDPMAHGKQKKSETRITRQIIIISNDPVDFQKMVRIDITQVP